MSKFSKFLELSGRRKKFLVQALLILIAVRGSLWLFPYRWVDRGTSSLRFSGEAQKTSDAAIIMEIAESVRFCRRFVPHASCLTQAQSTKVLLALNGKACDVKIGVDVDENQRFIAHAWVEVDGRIIIGKEVGHGRFSVLKRSGQSV
jgi:hypothetical protein